MHFRDLLQTELARRCARNPQYSLRAFARFLDVDPATLSQLLRGRRTLTPRTIRRLGVRLGINWLDYGILEVTHLQDFQADSRWIGRMFGITSDEVNICVQRLARLEMLRLDGKTWIDQSEIGR